MDFDDHSQSYESDLNSALQVTGETLDYFSKGRSAFLKQKLSGLIRSSPVSLLDYGCGIGGNTRSLMEALNISQYVGIDPSLDSINRANSAFQQTSNFSFVGSDVPLSTTFDLIYCNGVLHHIPPVERADTFEYLYHHTNPGGYLTIFENNPYNPGTRLVMSRCAFDKDAVTITPPEMVTLGQSGHFSHIHTSYLFFFPAFLKQLRFLEPSLDWCPLGGQYLTVFRRDP